MDHASRDAAQATARQMKALSHPTRVRLWAALGPDEATISQLSHRLALNKGNVAHHLDVLVAAALVRHTRSQSVRGGTERYFARTQSHLVLPAVAGGSGPGGAMVRNISEGIEAATDPHVHQRTIRLTPEQADQLSRHLDAVVHALVPADARHATYDVVTAVYRRL